MDAATLAVLCLFAAGLLDVVFKLYSRLPRSRGQLISGIGIVWFVLQCLYIYVSDTSIDWSSSTISFGVLAAVFVTVSNILLLEALGHLPISLGSTIYRLNTLPLVVLAFLFLGEQLDSYKFTGIVLGIVSVLVLYHRDSEPAVSSRYWLFLGVVVAASVIRALYGFTTKLGISQGANVDTMLLIGAIGWCIGGLIYARLRETSLTPTPTTVPYALVAGGLVFAVVWLLTKALQIGDATLVVPLANMSFIAAFTCGIALKTESFTARKLFAIALAVIAVVLLTRSD